MGFSPIVVGEIDTNSPLTDTLGAKIARNFDDLDARLTGSIPGTIPWLSLLAPMKIPYLEITSALTLGATHVVVVALNVAGDFDVTLPLAGSSVDVLYVIGEDKGGGGNTTNVVRSGANLLVDSDTPVTSVGIGDGRMLAFISDGVSKWRKVWSSIA